MNTSETSREKYDAMAHAWREIEAKLVALKLPHAVWVDCNYDPMDQTGLKLGIDRYCKSWRICLRAGKNEPLPIDQWPEIEQVIAAKHVDDLIGKARTAQIAIAIRVNEAIAHLEKFLSDDK